MQIIRRLLILTHLTNRDISFFNPKLSKNTEIPKNIPESNERHKKHVSDRTTFFLAIDKESKRSQPLNPLFMKKIALFEYADTVTSWDSGRLLTAIYELLSRIDLRERTGNECDAVRKHPVNKTCYCKIVAVLQANGLCKDRFHRNQFSGKPETLSTPINDFLAGKFLDNHTTGKKAELLNDCKAMARQLALSNTAMIIDTLENSPKGRKNHPDYTILSTLFSQLINFRINIYRELKRLPTKKQLYANALGSLLIDEILLIEFEERAIKLDEILISMIGDLIKPISTDRLIREYGYPDIDDNDLDKLL